MNEENFCVSCLKEKPSNEMVKSEPLCQNCFKKMKGWEEAEEECNACGQLIIELGIANWTGELAPKNNAAIRKFVKQKEGKLDSGILLICEKCSEELRKQPYVNLEAIIKEENDLREKYKEKIQASIKQYEKIAQKQLQVPKNNTLCWALWALGSLTVVGIIGGVIFWLIKKHKQG